MKPQRIPVDRALALLLIGVTLGFFWRAVFDFLELIGRILLP